MTEFAVILPAAGTSQRFGGRDKLLEELAGASVLQWAVEAFVVRQDVGEILGERFSVSDKIDMILRRLGHDGPLRFSDLFGEITSRVEIVVTFLALLELIRLKQVRAIQKNVFEEIEIAPATG